MDTNLKGDTWPLEGQNGESKGCGARNYKCYDWRPEGRDGESKRPASRAICDAPEILMRRSLISPCTTPSAGLLCRKPRTQARSHRRSPHSIRLSPKSLKGSCDSRLCDASEKFLCRVSYVHDTHGCPLRCLDPLTGQELSRPQSPIDPICLKHDCIAPSMEPAGVITRNFEYPWPPEQHTIIRLDSYVKNQGIYRRLGQLVKDSFRARPGDVLIAKIPRQHLLKDHGYVEFFTKKHEGCHLCPGDLLIRVGKFVRPNTWRYNKRHKLYLQTDEHNWLFIGMIDNFVNLLPLPNHGSKDHVDQHCRFFYPRRGDMVAHIQPPDLASQLEWFNPKTKMAKGDILVRMYLGEPSSSSQENMDDIVDGCVEIYLYAGKGLSWIFMGRDHVWFRDGFDLLDKSCRAVINNITS